MKLLNVCSDCVPFLFQIVATIPLRLTRFVNVFQHNRGAIKGEHEVRSSYNGRVLPEGCGRPVQHQLQDLAFFSVWNNEKYASQICEVSRPPRSALRSAFAVDRINVHECDKQRAS